MSENSFGEMIVYGCAAALMFPIAGAAPTIPLVISGGIAALDASRKYYAGKPDRQKNPDECDKNTLSQLAFEVHSSDPIQRTIYERLIINLTDREWQGSELRHDDLEFIRSMNTYDLVWLDFFGGGGLHRCNTKWTNSDDYKQLTIWSINRTPERSTVAKRAMNSDLNTVRAILDTKFTPLEYAIHDMQLNYPTDNWHPNPGELIYSLQQSTSQPSKPYKPGTIDSPVVRNPIASAGGLSRSDILPDDFLPLTQDFFSASLSKYGQRIYNLLQCPLFDEYIAQSETGRVIDSQAES